MGLRRAQRIAAAALLALLAATPALANPDVEAARGETYALLAIPLLLFAIIAIEVLVIRLALHPPYLWPAVIGANVLSAFIGLVAAVTSSFADSWAAAYTIAYAVEIAMLVIAWRKLRLARVLAAVIGANVLSTAAFFLLLLPGWNVFTGFVSQPRVPLTEAAHWGPASLGYRGRDQWMSFDAVDASHAWLLPKDLGLLSSTDGGRHWRRLRESANTIDFVSADIGWAERGRLTPRDPAPSVGRTTDGGRTWEWQKAGDAEITALAAIDAREAWVATASAEWPPKVRAGLLRTCDGGRSWQPIPIPPAGRIRAMAFPDRDHGWLVADPAEGVSESPESLTVLHTSDGGRTFQTALTPPLVLAPPTVGVTTRAIRVLNSREAWIAAGSLACCTPATVARPGR